MVKTAEEWARKTGHTFSDRITIVRILKYYSLQESKWLIEALEKAHNESFKSGMAVREITQPALQHFKERNG